MGTLISARLLYNCNLPTRKKAYFVVFLGNSLVNGYSSDYTQLVSADQNKYMAVSDMTQYRKLTSYVFHYVNRASFANAFGNFATCMIDLYDSGAYSDGSLFCYEYSVNGSSIVNGEQTDTWSSSDTNGYLYSIISSMNWGIRYLERAGYAVTIIGVNFGGVGISTGTVVQATYETEMNTLMAKIRERFPLNGGSLIPFIWGAPDGIAFAPPNLHYRNAILALTDPLVEYYDVAKYNCQANDTIHPRSHGVRAFGQFVASVLTKIKTGNNYPVASNVAITGTLKVNQAIGVSYTYSDTEGDAKGTARIHMTYATDANGTSEIDLYDGFEGGTFTLISTHLNTYIRARVTPVALTGAITGKAVYGSWQGPVIA